MTFGEKLKEARRNAGLSQDELAMKISVSRSAIAKWELRKTEPTASALITLSKFFDEHTDFLLGLSD
mgnify:CR=1 FL=1